LNPAGTVAAVLNPLLTKGVERTLNFFGGINNDHPPDIATPKPLLPQSTHSFSNAIGAVPLRKLRIEQTSNTPQFKNFQTSNTPKTTTEIAQIPSYYTRFNVSTTNQPGDSLVELPVIPLDSRYPYGPAVPATVGPNDPRTFQQLPTVSYLSLMYSDYVGTLEYTIDAVKTPSHNFSLQVAYVPFNGAPGGATFEQLQSCKWTTLDFRTNNRAKFTVPYISFHMMRQFTNSTTGRGDLPINPIYNSSAPATSQNEYTNNIGLSFSAPMRDPGKIVIRMLNPLNPTPIVSNSIEVLVHVAASPGFKFLVPRPFKGQMAAVPNSVDFPRPDSTYPAGFNINTVRQTVNAQSAPGMVVQQGDEMTPPSDKEKVVFGTMLQAMELHDDILTLCKRTYFYSNVTGTYYAIQLGAEVIVWSDFPIYATIPITPYVYSASADQPGSVEAMKQARGPVNPRDALLACFRWMRGGINLTVVSKPVNGFDKKPLVVTHIPPVGWPARISGNQARPVFICK